MEERARKPVPKRPAPAPARRAPVRRASPLRLLVVIVAGLAGGGAVVGAYWYLKVRPRVAALEDPHAGSEPRQAGTATLGATEGDFDREVGLPGDPLGMAFHGRELLVGNRVDPGGFLRLSATASGDGFEVEKVPVIETVYRQRMSFRAVTWNGKEYVAVTDGAWFQVPDKQVFTLLDPVTLRVVDRQPAPEGLGCLAWDGRGYWAATRRNVEDGPEPAVLYRLDQRLGVVASYDPPAVGCQGLAWDGKYLWLADVFTGNLYVLDVSSGPPRVVYSHASRFDYLSGVGFDGEAIWVAEYGGKKLHRLSPGRRAEWTEATGMAGIAAAAGTAGIAEAAPGSMPTGAEEVALEELRKMLRGEDSFARLRAEMELERRGIPVDYDREVGAVAPSRGPEEVAVEDWSIEMVGDRIRGSWRLFFGPDLFARPPAPAGGVASMPVFARYTVTVEGGTLAKPVERPFEARPGENLERDVELASGLGPGTYRASLFVHVQYVTREGTNRILNESALPLEVGR